MSKFVVVFVLVCLSSCSTLRHSLTLESVKPVEKKMQIVWNKNNDPGYDTGNLPIALNSPLIYEGIVYTGHNAGKFIAYELENGREIWSKNDSSTYHSSPIAYKDQILYGTVQGRVYSRNYLTGQEKFVVDLGASVESEGVIHNGRALFHLRNHQIFCLDVETGKILWAYKRSVPYLTTIQRVSKPIVYKDKVIVGFADGSVAALSLDEGLLVWESKVSNGAKFVDVDNSPVLVDDKLYVNSIPGPESILDANTGNIIRKSEIVASRSPLVIQNKLLFALTNGSLLLTDLQLNPITERKITTDAISNIVEWKGEYLLTTVRGQLLLVNKQNFDVIEQMHLGHSYSAVFGAVSVAEDKVALLSSRNRLIILK